VVAPLTSMNKENRVKVWSTVQGLRTQGMTNLWDGLKTGMNVLTEVASAPTVLSSSSSQQNTQTPPPSHTRTFSASSKRSSFFGSIGFGTRKQIPPPSTSEPKPALVSEDDLKAPLSPDTSASALPRDPTHRLPAIFILTDGQPNVEPPRGHIPMLKSYLDALPSNSPKLTISTFGFGYNLNSQLLDDIADLGQGMYGFIPDSGMVGTVFVHAVANLMATWATGCVLDVEVVAEDPKAQAKVDVSGCLPVTLSSWGASIRVGDLQYGQSRDIIVKLPSECFGCNAKQAVNVTARYSPHTLAADAPMPRITRTLERSHEVGSSVVLQHHVYRLSFVCAVSELFQNSKKRTTCPITGSQFERILTNHINNPVLKEYEPSTALTLDITSQVIQGLEPKHWSRWGMHYLPSLARSHKRQQCSNFKDEGLQVYGRDSSIFTSTRDSIDKMFDSLPPPEPSLKDRPVYRAGSSAPATYTRVASMSTYRSKAAPCFAGWCLVDTGDSQSVKVSDLRRGTVVRTPNGTARIANVLRTVCPGRVMDLCSVGRLTITPWHPINHEEAWVFPAEVCEPKLMLCDYVYSILLEPSSNPETHALCIEGTWCVTLGNGCADLVRGHAFLGDYARVVGALSQLDGFYDESGVVDSAGVARDKTTGLVCGFKRLEKGEGIQLLERHVLSQSVACEA
jgi:hypothetical protein